MTKFLLPFLLILTGAFARAEVVTIPGSSGRLINHTSLPSEAFEVKFSVRCTASRVNDCGSFEQTTFLNPDGTYEVPSFNLDAKSTPAADRRYSLYVFITMPDGHPQRPQGVAQKDFTTSVDLRRAALQNLVAPSFTLFESNAGTLDVQLSSGRDLADYLKNEGRDAGVEINIDFGLTGGQNMDSTHRLDQTGFSRKNWIELGRHYYMAVGEYAADAPFDFVVTAGYKDIKTGRAHFGKDLISLLGRLDIDDSDSNSNVAERRLTGSFEDSYFQLDYPLQDEMEFDEIGFSYATLNAECVNGKIAGELIYREGQFTDDPETSRVTVSGTCAGEAGEIVWPMKRKNGRTEILSAKFERIRASNVKSNSGVKSVSRLLFSTDVRDQMGEYTGEELTIFMPAYFADGTYAGQLRVNTGN